MRTIELVSPGKSHPRDGERMEVPDDFKGVLKLPLAVGHDLMCQDIPLHVDIAVETWIRWRQSPHDNVEQWIPMNQMAPLYRKRS